MATISFLAGSNLITSAVDLGGSGLGFYGPGNFGTSVRVGQYADNTYICDSTGAVAGPKANNVKYVHPYSGQLGTSDIHALRDIPNYLATLNVRFTHTSPCQTQNATVTIFDRVSTNNPASGVTCKVAQLIHPWSNMQPSGALGSGDTQWSTLGGSGGTINGRSYDTPLALIDSPGTSGLRPSGSSTIDSQHDFYLICAASPDSIGSKTQFGLAVSLEYI